MELTPDFKSRILAAIHEHRGGYPSDAKHSKALGISPSVYANLKRGNTEGQLSDAKWYNIARQLSVSVRPEDEWVTGETTTFVTITENLSDCQRSGTGSIFCDLPGIGKTHTARWYVRHHRNAVYLDCSQVISHQGVVRGIAREYGLQWKGRYRDVYEDLVYYLRSIERPLIILDEAGDLSDTAFMQIKKLYNGTAGVCGWYLMGADGLKAKWDRAVKYKKVGYAEMFSRMGDKYLSAIPHDPKIREKVLASQVRIVASLSTKCRAVRRWRSKNLRRCLHRRPKPWRILGVVCCSR